MDSDSEPDAPELLPPAPAKRKRDEAPAGADGAQSKRAKQKQRKLKQKKEKRKKQRAAQGEKAAPKELAQEAEEEEEEEEEEDGAGRQYTVTVAVPGSIIANAQSPELRAYLAGQIARAAALFCVDEVVVFNDACVGPTATGGSDARRVEPNLFLARILQYTETPQYLRKALFPMHPDLRFAGLLNPLDMPHHMRATEAAPFREGVVVAKPGRAAEGCFVNVGLLREAIIDRQLQPGVRVTVRMLDQAADPARSGAWEAEGRKHPRGVAVAPSAPREETGTYWGYRTRLASNLGEVWTGCPYKDGYDLTVGISASGRSVAEPGFTLPSFKHMLLVLGGVAGLEAIVDADESLDVAGDATSGLFDMYLNTCPEQGSRTIRTEEAMLISLAVLRPHVVVNTGKVRAS